jgi:formylglycine-generating enzyme required for sulfatase activity
MPRPFRAVLALTVATWGVVVASSHGAQAGKPSTARVGPGTYLPFYPVTPKEREVPIQAFELDKLPVTNGDFLAFVKESPKWRRDKVNRLFADEHYLQHWSGPDELGNKVDPRQPVVSVSWFAAKAYCAARGARLPTESEWEFAAAASEKMPDSRGDLEFRERILAWYSKPNPGSLPRVGGPPNYWGVSNLHGLLWEWVLDFNSTLVGTDGRDSGGKELRFCGGGALAADDKTDFASFMRTAFRSALHADYTTKNLGFRCAMDVKEPSK